MDGVTKRMVDVNGWIGNIEEQTLANDTYRTVLFTGVATQLTVMRLARGEEIGVEMHDHLDQFIRVESGSARITFGPSADEVTETYDVSDDWAVIIPGGTWHNVINTGDGDLKLYSLYSPPEHPPGTVHRTKAEGDEARAEEHGAHGQGPFVEPPNSTVNDWFGQDVQRDTAAAEQAMRDARGNERVAEEIFGDRRPPHLGDRFDVPADERRT